MTLLEPMLFRDGHPAAHMDLLQTKDPGAVIAAHSGHFAIHQHDGAGEHLLARDLLGVHKLFFAVDRDGGIDAATYLIDLRRGGHAARDIFSVPSGHYVRIHPRERRYSLVRWGRLEFGTSQSLPGQPRSMDEFAALIRSALERTFRMISERIRDRPIYVTLSGGLDSTTIAAFAREHFENVHAVTFALQDSDEVARDSDLSYARRVAAELGLPLIEVLGEPDEVLDLLDDVLVYGQDWRDFNVHCGLVNAAIARALGARHRSGPRPVVLTGDTMNELLADYAPLVLQGVQYYRLPQLDRGKLRRFLVRGLDSGDREVGIFAHFGLDTLQPYAICAQEYAALWSEFATAPDSKSQLVRAVMGKRIPEYVFRRAKVRAQAAVDGLPAGTLALLVARGIDQAGLKRRFARLLAFDPHSLHEMMRCGLYRFSTVFPTPVAQSA